MPVIELTLGADPRRVTGGGMRKYDDELKVRVTTATRKAVERFSAIAGRSVSHVMREWIHDGLATITKAADDTRTEKALGGGSGDDRQGKG